LDGQGFDAGGWWVLPGPSGIEVREACVHVSSMVEARVGVTHAGERLCNGVKLVANVSSPDRVAAAAGSAVAYAAREYEKDGDRVTEAMEEGVHGAKGFEKREPGVGPSGVLGGLAAGGNGVPQFVLRKAEVSCEIVVGERVRRTQPLGCGEREVSWVRSATSDK